MVNGAVPVDSCISPRTRLEHAFRNAIGFTCVPQNDEENLAEMYTLARAREEKKI
jgi:hypothetical protein